MIKTTKTKRIRIVVQLSFFCLALAVFLDWISNYTLNASQALQDGDYWWKVIPFDGKEWGGLNLGTRSNSV